MANIKNSLERTLGKLTAEMARPKKTASVLRAQRSLAGAGHRKLELIDAFHGYACSWCGCRFPEAAPPIDAPNGLTPATRRRQFAAEREKQFAAHVCSR